MVRNRYNDRFVRFCCCCFFVAFFLVVVVLTCHVHWCSPETATKTNNAENYGHKHTGPNASNHAAAPVINEEHYIDHILLIKTHFEFKKIYIHVLRVKLAMQKKALWKAKIKRIVKLTM